MIARFPYGGSEHPDVSDWLVETVIKAKSEPRIESEILRYRVDDTPITLGRNRAIKQAIAHSVDMLLMIDADMKPDAYLPANEHKLLADDRAKPFWDTSFDFLWKLRAKEQYGVVGAPYCGPPPWENIYVFHWEDRQSDLPDDESSHSLEQYSRHHASVMSGIQEAAALPTGLILMDMNAVEKLVPPYTYYEWADDGQDAKASTEDVTFTRDMSMAGVPVYCNWDAWAGHWKSKCVGKPHILRSSQVGDKFKHAVLRDYNIGPGEQLIDTCGGSNGRHLRQRFPDTSEAESSAEGAGRGDDQKAHRRLPSA